MHHHITTLINLNKILTFTYNVGYADDVITRLALHEVTI
jgi:hypothetical protein